VGARRTDPAALARAKALLWWPVRAVTSPLLRFHLPWLAQTGWVRSRRERRCVDRDGNPIPWITYPAIHLLGARVHRELDVFEYGAGASTLWWAAHARSVTAVDHAPDWGRWVSASLPANATVRHVPLDDSDAYTGAPQALGRTFDVIVIDGRRRVRCVPFALATRGAHGVIVFDNADRPEYEPGLRALAAAGLRRLDLVGLAPMIDYQSMTSIFYRDGNCLGL
jgi:hypothetical protein